MSLTQLKKEKSVYKKNNVRNMEMLLLSKQFDLCVAGPIVKHLKFF